MNGRPVRSPLLDPVACMVQLSTGEAVMVDPVRNDKHGNGDRNDNKVAKVDRRLHEEHDERVEKEKERNQDDSNPPRR
jgi:hypothetical protein